MVRLHFRIGGALAKACSLRRVRFVGRLPTRDRVVAPAASWKISLASPLRCRLASSEGVSRGFHLQLRFVTKSYSTGSKSRKQRRQQTQNLRPATASRVTAKRRRD